MQDSLPIPQTPSFKEASTESSGGSFDIFELVLFGPGRFRWWLLPFATIGLTVGVVRSFMVPNTYSSSGEMFISLGMRETISPEQVIGGPAHTIVLSDELHVLKSPELFENVARKIGPDRILEAYDPTRYDNAEAPVTDQDYWVHRLHLLQKDYFNRNKPKGKIDNESEGQIQLAGAAIGAVVTIRGAPLSQVMSIGARAKSPELAQEIVDATMQACKERHRDVFSNQFNEVFVTEEMDKANTELENVTTEYYTHRKSCGFYDIAKQRNQIFGDLAQIENSIAQSTNRLAEIKAERETTTEKLKVLPLKVTEVREPQYQPNPIWAEYNQKLIALGEREKNLSQTFREGTKPYEDAKKGIAADKTFLEEQRDAIIPVIKVGDPYTVEIDNPDVKLAQQKLDQLDVDQEKLLASQTREAGRRLTLVERLDALLLCEPVHERLQEEIAQLNGRIGKFKDSMTKAKTLELVDQDLTMSNLRVLDPASFNPRKVAPKRGKSILMGLAVGCAAWAGFALLRQFLDVKVRFPKSVERVLGIKVLGIVPEQKRWKRLGRRIRARIAA